MNIILLILSIILITNYPLYSTKDEFAVEIDTSRFQLITTEDNFHLLDNLQKITISLKSHLLINQDEEVEEKTYVSSFNFSKKVNSFDIGNGLIGIQLSSFSVMSQGSAQAAEGRDVFLVFDPQTNMIYNKILEFGITKQRSRYMGCLSAKTSHFIVADVDGNGLIDIGRIKEELKCEDIYDPNKDTDGILGPFFFQDSVKWYVFENNQWVFDSLHSKIDTYVDLPLNDIKINPIDFFGFIKWHNYDPQKWDSKSVVSFYPQYRLLLIKKELEKTNLNSTVRDNR